MLELNYTNYINSQTRIPFSVKKHCLTGGPTTQGLRWLCQHYDCMHVCNWVTLNVSTL